MNGPASRRSVLGFLGAGTAGLTAVLSTGAFTQVEADRELSIGIDADDEALLTIEPNDDLASDAAEIGDDGEFIIDLDGASTNSAFSLGRLDDIRDPTVVEESAFVVRAQGTYPIDLGVSLEETPDEVDITVVIAETPAENPDNTVSIAGGEDADISANLDPEQEDPGDRVLGAIAVDADDAPEDLTAELTFTAELLDGD